MFIIFSHGKTMNSKILLGLLAVVPLILGGCTNKCGVQTGAKTGDVSALTASGNSLFAQNGIDKVYFHFGKSTLTDAAKEIIRKQAEFIKNSNIGHVTIEGRTDERGTSEYNMALGAKRAEAVKNELVKKGINSGIITTISYGKESPVANKAEFTDMEEYHALNRVSITVADEPAPIGG